MAVTETQGKFIFYFSVKSFKSDLVANIFDAQLYYFSSHTSFIPSGSDSEGSVLEERFVSFCAFLLTKVCIYTNQSKPI